MREGHHLHVGVLVPDDLTGPELVRRVQVRVQERHGDRGHPEGAQPGRGLADRLLVEGRLHLAFGVHPLRDLKSDPPAGDGIRRRVGGVPDLLFVAAPELDLVPEALGDQEAGDGARHLDHGVVPGGGAVHDRPGVGDQIADGDPLGCGQPGQPRQHAFALVLRSGRCLLEHHRTVRAEEDAVGERAPDVDADPIAHGPPPGRALAGVIRSWVSLSGRPGPGRARGTVDPATRGVPGAPPRSLRPAAPGRTMHARPCHSGHDGRVTDDRHMGG